MRKGYDYLMTPLLTVDELRGHIDTDLADDRLAELLDDADAEIVRRYGEHTGTVTETLRTNGDDEYVYLPRRIASFVSVTETIRSLWGAEQTTTLAVGDYTQTGLRSMRRRNDGTNPANTWGEIVEVAYVPVADLPRRLRVTVDLVRLAVAYTALASSSIGDSNTSSVDYARERERLLRVLDESVVGRFA